MSTWEEVAEFIQAYLDENLAEMIKVQNLNYMSINDVAQYLRCSRTTAVRFIESNNVTKIPLTDTGGKYAVRRREIDAAIRKREKQVINGTFN